MKNSKFKLWLFFGLIAFINLCAINILGPSFSADLTPTPIDSSNEQDRSCQYFVVVETQAFARHSPSNRGEIITTLYSGELVCVLEQLGRWYMIDLNPQTSRRETAYIFERVLELFTGTLPPPITPSGFALTPSGFF